MYFLTLFPKAKLIDGSSEDKRRVAPHATIGEPVVETTFEAVVKTASENTISFNQYSASDRCKPGQVHRHGNHFLKTNLIGLDIDGNITLTAALEKLRALGWKFGLYTSFNHRKSGGDKFRVVLELEAYITDPSTYRFTWEAIHSEFLGLDAQCKDVARLFFHSDPETRQVFVEDGSLVKLVTVAPQQKSKFADKAPAARTATVDANGWENLTIKAKLPIEVRNWLTGIDEYGEPISFMQGSRSGTFYKLALLCKERGYSREWCDERLGKRLREDENFIADYGIGGAERKISDTLDQIFARDSRHAMPALFNFADLNNPRMFVDSWLKSKSMEVDRNGSFCVGNKKWSPKQLLHTLVLDYDEHYREYNREQELLPKNEQRKVRRISRDAIESAVVEYVDVKRNDHRTKLMESIKYSGHSNNLSELRKFVNAISGKDDETYVAVLAHFMWQVKRKVFHLPVQYHMMVILSGVQGNGKSTSVKEYLLSPIADFMTRPSLADLADRKRAEAYQYNYVVFCDEMEQADRTDIDGLKNFITTDKLNVREMYSMHEIEYVQNCTAIGCTNRSLATLIYDPTGMRRFFEILTDPQMRANGWSKLASVDYLKMWQQIDESIPGSRCYIMPLMEQIQALQEETRVESPIESFLLESGAMPESNCQVKEVHSDSFFADYRMFSNSNGHKAKDKTFFGKHLANYGITRRRVREGDRRPYYYAVNAAYRPINEITP